MKRLLLFLLLVGASSSHASFSVNLDAGQLKGFGGALTMQADNAAPHTNGSLLLLIAAGGDTSFSNSLAPGQYVSGNDVILGAGGFDTNGGANETLTAFSNLSGTDGDLIALRWFPSITYGQFLASATPTAGQNFGTYNPLADGNPNNNPDIAFDSQSSPWAVPAGNTGLLNLDFFTTDSDQGGTQAPPEGYANFAVTAVPEPATYVSALLAAMGAVTMKRKISKG
jgi:hypothetical protein